MAGGGYDTGEDTGGGCKEPRRYNGSACHNSVAEGKFLSCAASGQTG